MVVDGPAQRPTFRPGRGGYKSLYKSGCVQVVRLCCIVRPAMNAVPTGGSRRYAPRGGAGVRVIRIRSNVHRQRLWVIAMSHQTKAVMERRTMESVVCEELYYISKRINLPNLLYRNLVSTDLPFVANPLCAWRTLFAYCARVAQAPPISRVLGVRRTRFITIMLFEWRESASITPRPRRRAPAGRARRGDRRRGPARGGAGANHDRLHTPISWNDVAAIIKF
ncbi:hypothetical protein EVAR_97288_1 [Eumeta japonica]|uniref:Uncharacterized protein n=1 Tax=Eumeta variegata TaxID=151549 RepID=A0A4C1XDC0_EUMVA|nr:hypothetical protein EVAR_97288_1 [Eumeta japonica]